jgi:thioredoxin 1
MLIQLEPSGVEEYVHQPGVTILDWRNPGSPVSLLFDQVLEETSDAHGDVRFGTVDMSKARGAAREWQIEEAPSVTAFRDGVLVFSRPGPLPQAALEGLIEAIWSLDMNEIRKGINGHGSRVLIAFNEGGRHQ